MAIVVRTTDIVTRAQVKANRRVMYLFGDNELRVGYGGQAKEMRGEPNTKGIITKWTPTRNEGAYLTDESYVLNCDLIRMDINNAIQKFKDGEYQALVIPPLGVGLAELPTRAPNTYAFLQSELDRLEQAVIN
jgi:hypothetical protein